MLRRLGRFNLVSRLRKIGCVVMDSEQSSTGDGPRPQFGSRHLRNPEDVFQHNAWDDVQWDAEQEMQAKNTVALNSENRMAAEQVEKIEQEAGQLWDKFYSVHQNRFFKDRMWLFTEFPELLPQAGNTERINVLEVKVIEIIIIINCNS
jgi:hypothetical protein